MKNNRFYKIVLLIGQIFLPFALSYLSQRFSIGRGYDFKISNLNIILINYLIWALIFLFFKTLFKKQYKPVILYLVFFTFFSIANRYKIKFLNQPLRVLDFTIGRGVTGFVPLVIKYTNLKKELIFSGLGLVFSFFILKKFFIGEFIKTYFRIFIGIFSLILLLIPFSNPTLYKNILSASKVKFNAWDRADNCRNNGIIFCFLHELSYLKHTPPENYNKANIDQIKKQFSEPIINQKEGIVKPNIILILSESLWDPKNLPQLKLSQDPLKNIRQDIKGDFISPVFGGETANVEFEILTGLNNYLFPDNNYPYTESIKKPMPSLFTLFKNNHYLTTAFHPYSSWFYNRDQVYKYFGLDKFTNLSNMSDYQTAGPFVSEKSFIDEILRQFNSTEQAQFIFGVSIQNHAPYEANRFPNPKIEFKSNLNQEDTDTLQSYIEGIYLTDQFYQQLKDEIKKSNKPTIVILFGDHLPYLGPDYDIYRKLGMDVDNESKLHTTPITIWSNYPVKINNIGQISPAFLSNKILDLAQIQPQYQFSFTNKFAKNTQVLTKKVQPDIQSFKSDLELYRLLQYDLIYGKQYFLKAN